MLDVLQQFSRVCYFAPIGVAFVSLEGQWMKVNPALSQMMGYTEEELIGASLQDFSHSMDLRELLDRLQQLLQRDIDSFQLEKRFLHKSGQSIWGMLTACLIEDAQGAPAYFVFQIMDSTDKMRLQEIEQLHQSLIKYTPIGICALDQDGKIVHANPACEHISGYSIPELIQKNFRDLVCTEKIQMAEGHFYSAFQQEVVDVEIPIKHKNGSLIDLMAASSPIIINGETVGIYIIVKDITEAKRTEEWLRRSEKLSVIGELAAGIAHEIRNPLTSLRGFVQVLQNEDANPEHKPYYSIMLSEVDRINFIVSELLLLAKPEKRLFEYRDIVSKIQHVITLLQAEANLHNVQIRTEINSEIPLVYCESDKLKQVFLNILKNAIDAMPHAGEILVQVNTTGKEVQIQIYDQGIGIPKDMLTKICQPFYTTKETGTGLGLTICHRIIENHQGKMRVESEVGKGTMVEIMLPVHNTSTSAE